MSGEPWEPGQGKTASRTLRSPLLTVKLEPGVRQTIFGLVAAWGILLAVPVAPGQEAPATDPAPATTPAVPATSPAAEKAAEKPVPLNKQGTVLLDAPGGRLILKGRMCLKEGLLEMLVCKANTKEHESVFSVDSDAFVIHGGLLALGAKTGRPVQFQPEYRAPEGQKIAVTVSWKDEKGKEVTWKGQQLVRHALRRYFISKIDKIPPGLTLDRFDELRYDDMTSELIWYGQMSEKQRDAWLAKSKDKAWQDAINGFFDRTRTRELEADFVFAGSVMDKLSDGSQYYLAEAGNVICVANFGDAMIDVAMKSSASNDNGLEFEPYTERLPKQGTDVMIELRPIVAKSENATTTEPK